MHEVEIITDVYTIKDTEGNVVIEAPIMELYYLIGFGMDEANHTTSRLEKLKYTAEKINKEYGSELGWAQVLEIVNKIDEILEQSKKNS